MASVGQIREALSANLAVLAQTNGAQNSAYILSNTTPPTLMLMPGPPGGGDFTEYHQAMGNGLETMTWTVRCEVGTVSDIGAQKRLDRFLDVEGADSVMQALEKKDGPNGEVTLGGLVSGVTVTRSVAGLVNSQDGSSQKLAAEWEVQIYT